MENLKNTKLPIYYNIVEGLLEDDGNGGVTNKSIHKEFMRLVKIRDEWEDVWHSSTNPTEKSHAHTEFKHCLNYFRRFLNEFDEDVLFGKLK